MFALKDIQTEITRLDAISGGHVSEVPISVSKRLTRTLGKCGGRLKNGVWVVEKMVFADRLMRLATEEHFLEVVRHEYAHAYVIQKTGEMHKHDKLWRKYAIQFGCSGKTKVLFPEIDLIDI